ncbi:MAG: hypothetical protein ACI9F2_000198 [Lysobacterales bacterium]|jgi:uncharacterized protein YbaR (Trm112 family)
MIDEELLSVLACPETKKNLVLIDEALIKSINDKIKANDLLYKNKAKVEEVIDGGLKRVGDDDFVYPIRNNIPVLLVEELIDITTV